MGVAFSVKELAPSEEESLICEYRKRIEYVDLIINFTHSNLETLQQSAKHTRKSGKKKRKRKPKQNEANCQNGSRPFWSKP